MKNSNCARFARALFFYFCTFRRCSRPHNYFAVVWTEYFPFFFNQSLNGSYQFNFTIASTHFFFCQIWCFNSINTLSLSYFEKCCAIFQVFFFESRKRRNVHIPGDNRNQRKGWGLHFLSYIRHCVGKSHFSHGRCSIMQSFGITIDIEKIS